MVDGVRHPLNGAAVRGLRQRAALQPPPSGLSAAAVAAWRSSSLASRLSSDADDVLTGASEVVVAAGDLIYRLNSSGDPMLGVMVEGLARIYTVSPQGRQATIRYVSEGDVLGLPVALAATLLVETLPLLVQALTCCHVLRVSVPRFREVVGRDVSNMWGLVTELTATLVSTDCMLAENVFLPVRCRVARHMLDLATRDQQRLVVRATQQDIADAIGSVREVVSRALIQLRDDALIHRERSVYVIDDPARLHAAAML